MQRLTLFVVLSVSLYACGGPTLQQSVKYSRLSVNTVMIGVQAADAVNASAFAGTSDALMQEAYVEHVQPVAAEMGLEGEENVCSATGLVLTDDAQAELQDACDAGFAQWCEDIKPVWKNHCLRTCIIHTTKDGLRVAEKVVDGMQYVQQQYSADSKFNQLKEEDKLKWTDYALEVKEWFSQALVLLGSLVHLLHESGIDIPPALNTITDVAGGFADLPHNYEAPACECPTYPENSGCEVIHG